MTDALSRLRHLPRLLRTLRHLRPVQVWGRLWMRVYRPRVDTRPAPPMRAASRRWQGCARAPSLVGPATLRLLNVERTVATAADWDRADWPRLWRYNLHYFDDLAADEATVRPAGDAVGPCGPPTNSERSVPDSCRSGGSRDAGASDRGADDARAAVGPSGPPTEGVGALPAFRRSGGSRDRGTSDGSVGNERVVGLSDPFAEPLVGPSGPPTEGVGALPAFGRSGGSRDQGAQDRDATARTRWQRALIARWITENPPARGTGWEPYPTSLRMVNWIKWALAGNALDSSMPHSLAVQARWLHRRLECHLLGNHLWANAKALVFAGAFFDGDEAAGWHRRGLALIRRELAEQILPDGGHFERSPMYHAIVLEDLLDLVQLASLQPALVDAAEVAHWRKTVTCMLRWLRVMTHPDGGIALFNDAAFGIAPDCAALEAYAARLGVPVDTAPLQALETLPESGYVRMQAGDAVLIADVGEIGPDYLPGHAHADTLSFELSLRGRRVLVNGGTSTYEPGAERKSQRGTAAHNTVVVDGVDSSEVWAAFRVGRRAHPRDVAWGRDGDTLWLRGAHDGYAHLSGHPVHQREWRLTASGLVVTDRIDGRCDRAMAHYHVAPAWRVDSATKGAGILRSAVGDGDSGLDWRATPDASIVGARHHPAFGVARDCQRIEVPLAAEGATLRLHWQ